MSDRDDVFEGLDPALVDAARTVQKRRAAEQEPVKRQEPQHTTIRRRTDNLRAALSVAKNKDHVKLPELSRRSPSGQPVVLRVRRLSIQELAASELLPRRADALVSSLIELSMEMTENPRKQYNVTSAFSREDVDTVISELYGGWTRDALAAFFELQCAVCCAAVIDKDYRFYMTPEEVDADPERGVYVWDVPEQDIDVIFQWAMKQEEAAENSVLPFRDTGDAGRAVLTEQERRRPGERPDRM